MKAFTVALVPVLVVLGLVFTVVVVLGPDSKTPKLRPVACNPLPPLEQGQWHLSRRQWRSVTVIVRVGKRLKVPARGWVVAVATAAQESKLLPLPYGDRDSLGLFQQRSAWGTRAQRMNPASATRMFYTGGHAGQPGLLDIDGWQSMPVPAAAQAVQHSAYPDAYTKWVPLAVAAVAKLTGDDIDTGCTSDNRWVLPVAAGTFTLTAGFGDCGSHWAACHTGQDFAVPIGTPVRAVHDGIVTTATATGGAYGRLVKLLHPGHVAAWYAHLSRILVDPGQHVSAGELIALSGDSGNTTGPHLHLEVRTHATRRSDGTPVDPLAWLHHHHAFAARGHPATAGTTGVFSPSAHRVKGH